MVRSDVYAPLLLLIALLLAVPWYAEATTGVERLVSGLRLGLGVIFGSHTLRYDGKRHGLQVIGAGFPRTGTKSIESALSQQGHRIYDLRSVIENNHQNRWLKAAREWKQQNNTTELEALVLEMEKLGYTATLDTPCYLMAKPLSELRPDAKVLLSVRDNAEVWFRSFQFIVQLLDGIWFCRPWTWIIFGDLRVFLETIYSISMENYVFPPELNYPTHLARPLPWYEYPVKHVIQDYRDLWISHYNSYHDEFIKNSPPDKLLVFNVKQGWEPWVEFFDMDPNDPLLQHDFPYVNDRKTLQVVQTIREVVGVGFPIIVLLLVMLLAWLVLKGLRMINGMTSTLFVQKKMKQS